ncbi:MAG TPA: OmpA family protein [Candidatus Dormibacteraeota bacterium]
MAGEEGGGGEKARSAWPDLLSAAGKQLMPVLLTGASLIGFVAFAGGVIVWTRFSAAKVPPDQAVNAVPRDELVAIGSSLLLLFGFFGVMALIGAFLVDRGGRATPGMARALLVFFLVEGVTTIIVADGISLARTIAVAALFALPVAAAIWTTWVGSFVSLEDDLPTREGERPGRRGYGMFVLPAAPKPAGPKTPTGVRGVPPWLEARRELLVIHAPIVAVAIGVAGGALIELALGTGAALLVWLGLSFLAFLGLALRRSHKLGRGLRRDLDESREAIMKKRLEKAEEEEGWGSDQGLVEAERRLNERPMRLELKLNGVVLMLLALLASVALPYALLGKFWVGVSIGAAAALTSALWRISMLSVDRVVWFGVAVFISVPLFGTLTAMARNIDDPQVQPMALIRNTDGPNEAIQGLYVTEANDRVYFATVATEGCTDDLTPNSGRLEWVPKSEVVAMSVGPLQSVKDAAASALEMSYALTPAVETPAGSGPEDGLTSGEEPAAGVAPAPPAVTLDKRLEDAGPAVRPFYGAGLSLTPDNASPGQPVTLRMSAPNNNDQVHGFGRTRNGHTLRVGGVRATIAKEFAHRADTAEYVETKQGALLRLEKGEPYVKGGGGQYERLTDLDSQLDKRRFFKLVDHRVLSVGKQKMGELGGEGDEEGIYLPVETDPSRIPSLKHPERVVKLLGLAEGGDEPGKPKSTHFEPRPKAQAWHEREIRFLVPDNVSTGAVTVECSQLAGQPLLRVAHKPEARISVRMHAGSTRVSFDSGRSGDADGESISRRWNVSGLRRGNLPSMSIDLPPRPRAYIVRMTATDESGRTDTAELRLLRLPASLFKPNEANPRNDPVLREAKETLETAARKQTPAAIEIDGYADDPGTGRHNVHLSLRRAERVRERLLRKPEISVQGGVEIPVRTLAYGKECPVVPGPGHSRSNRRVDVFVLEQGVSMTPPANCHPRRFQSTEWKLPAG